MNCYNKGETYMEIFTYQDYLKYQELLEEQREKVVDILRENEENYAISSY